MQYACIHIHTYIHAYIHKYVHTETVTVDCGSPLPTHSNSSITVNYSSTVEGSNSTFKCTEGFIPSDIVTATCHPNGSWVPDPTTHVCTIDPTGE